MNRKQWVVLTWSFVLIGFMFIGLDQMNGSCLNAFLEFNIISAKQGIPTDLVLSDIWCVVNSEMFEPFIYLSYALSIVFMILGLMEKKQ